MQVTLIALFSRSIVVHYEIQFNLFCSKDRDTPHEAGIALAMILDTSIVYSPNAEASGQNEVHM